MIFQVTQHSKSHKKYHKWGMRQITLRKYKNNLFRPYFLIGLSLHKERNILRKPL